MFCRATLLLGGTCLTAALGLSMPAGNTRNEGDVETGEILYRSLCQRCHGPDGDATSYPGIVPVAGVHRRLDEDEIVRVAAGTLGRSFDEHEGRALYAFLHTLGGAKGFPQAGWLFSPHLTERKLPKVRRYRIVDTRSQGEYATGHVPNAVLWPRSIEAFGCRLSGDGAGPALEALGVSPETFVVVYDDGGGRRAACVWWALASAGHNRTAVLDGGWRRWVKEGRRIETARASLPVASYPGWTSAPTTGRCDVDVGRARELRYDWQRLMDDDGFRPADEIEAVLREAGFRGRGGHLIPGSSTSAPGTAFVLKLLGYEPVFVSREASGVCVGPS